MEVKSILNSELDLNLKALEWEREVQTGREEGNGTSE